MNGFTDKGYVFLKDVYKKEELNKINEDFFNFYIENNIQGELNKKEDVNKDFYYVNNTYNILNNFFKQQYYYIPVIDNRLGHNRITDVGMIDIFNADKLLYSINKIINTEVILSILKKITNKDWKLFRVNYQICNNVINPNNYHCDNDECIKFTIFMNDIKEEFGGGLSYIEETHKVKKFSNNQIKNFYGNIGDVLISYQNGFHKKLIQQNSINYFIVFNFIPKI
jgi:hypothetical protein|tara:strand:+ start:11087 stop:11761 length:675 start_codon:yes stop_codon:yes gene_type:complete